MSNHSCDVVQVKLEEHPNADSLSVVRIGGYQCVVRTADWKEGDLGVYIPPDSVVPDTEEFAFLGKNKRIKVRKLRGVYSQGLLIPAPSDSSPGDDLMEQMEIYHYEPPLPMSTGGDNVKPPEGHFPVYDVENYNKYPNIIKPGTEVIITEKIHGASARYKWQNNELYVGSRKNWKKYDPKNIWWRAVKQNPWIEEWCGIYSHLTLYGEVFGPVQSLKYGAKNNDVFFRVFDLWDGNNWLDFTNAIQYAKDEKHGIFGGVNWVPILYRGPFDEQVARQLAEEDSNIDGAKHHREGVVIKPVIEQWDQELGRVQLKIVGNRYLEKS